MNHGGDKEANHEAFPLFDHAGGLFVVGHFRRLSDEIRRQSIGIGKRQGKKGSTASVQGMETSVLRNHFNLVAATDKADVRIRVSLADMQLAVSLFHAHRRLAPTAR